MDDACSKSSYAWQTQEPTHPRPGTSTGRSGLQLCQALARTQAFSIVLCKYSPYAFKLSVLSYLTHRLFRRLAPLIANRAHLLSTLPRTASHPSSRTVVPPTFCHAVPRTLEVLLNLSLLPWGPVLTTINHNLLR